MPMDPEKRAGLLQLRMPFPENQISAIPKKDKESGKTVWLDYVGHAALTSRLLDVDPEWTWTPMGHTPEGAPVFDETGGLWILLTVCGVTRPGYGNAKAKSDAGDRMKEIIGDALRNAAMRFGAALDLWHKGGPLSASEGDEAKGRQGAIDAGILDGEGEAAASQESLPAGDPRQARARELLAKFATAQSHPEIDDISALFRAEWNGEHGLRTVPNLAETIVAMRTQAQKRLGG